MDSRLLNKPALAMVQPKAFPGTYKYDGSSIDEIIDKTLKEINMIKECGFDGIIVQNMNDMPIKQKSNFQTVAFLTRLCTEIKNYYPDLLMGILVNWDGVASLAVAAAVNADFIRIEHLYTGANVTSSGILESQAVDILELKMRLGINIPIFADIYEVHGIPLGKKSHSDAAWEAVNETMADGLFTSGKNTEESLSIAKQIKEKLPDTPVYLGGGANGENISELIKEYDGVSVATWIKDGNMENDINPKKAKIFMKEVKSRREE
ncbi:BtpA/SgcQ family protein [Aerococcus urinae]|uniref:BtpA/SgcQ family protein n=1 Tax=Aerococcus urinae TaxID=1376 RepID=UPI0025505CBB|nr:BtpA/SgcQ family protein [Aerococcus urinae]MDK6371112.1 BtpA/SgcQ family protein [Aerococcus urinae]